MKTSDKSLKVLLSHQDEGIVSNLNEILTNLGCNVLPICSNGRELVQRATSDGPDLIVSGVELPDFDAITALVEISRTTPIPAIIVTPQRSLEIVERAMQDHVLAYLVEPVNPAEVEPTIYLVLRRFEQFEELRKEVEDLQETLAQRKEIERAKGLLMARHDEDEEAAYKRLRRHATDRRIKLVDAARRILSEHTNG